jgi:hypothetical protein
MTTFRKLAALAALSLSLVVGSGVALAGEKGDHPKLNFPVAAAEYQAHVEARLEKKRARMEEHLTKKSVPADKAAEIRTRFNEGAAKVKAQVAQAVADGTVTKEEAKAVRQAGKGMHGGKHHGKGHKKGEKKGTPA